MDDTEIDNSYLETLMPILKKHDQMINESDLYIPDMSLILGVFVAILEHIGMDVGTILIPQSYCHNIFENSCAPYSNSIKLMNVTLIIKNILKLLGYEEFSYGDVLKPRQPKSSLILTLLTNFIIHKEENDEIVQTKIREIIEFDEKVNALQEEHQYLEQTLPNKILESEHEKENNGNKVQEISQLESKISSLKSIVETQSKEFEELKKQNAEINIKLKNVKYDNDEMQIEIDSLTNDIVKSPQKIIEDAEKCHEKLNYLTDQLKEHKMKLEEIRQHKNQCAQSFQRIESCAQFPNSLFIDIDKIKKIHSEITTLKEKNIDISTSIQNIKNEIQYYNEQLEIKHLATKRIEANLERKRDDAKKKLQKIQTTKEDNISEIKNLQISLKQTTEIKAKLEEELNNFNVDADDNIGRYNVLCEVSSALHNLENILNN